MSLEYQLAEKNSILTQSIENIESNSLITPAESTFEGVHDYSPKTQSEILEIIGEQINKIMPLQYEHKSNFDNNFCLDITTTKDTINLNVDGKLHDSTVNLWCSNEVKDSTLNCGKTPNTNYKMDTTNKYKGVKDIPELQDEAHIFSSPEKLFSAHPSQLDVYDTAKENKSVDMIANYLKIALRRKSENSHYQYKKKLLQNYSKENLKKGDPRNIQGVEKPGGTANYNNSTLRKPILTYSRRRLNESAKVKRNSCESILQFDCNANSEIDCEASPETYTINLEFPTKHSKISFFSEMEQSTCNTYISNENNYNECENLTGCDANSNNKINFLENNKILSEMVHSCTNPLNCSSPICKPTSNMSADENVELFQNILPIFSTDKTDPTLFVNDFPRPEDCSNTEIDLFGINLETIYDFDTLINDDQCTLDVLENIINADNNDTAQLENSLYSISLEQEEESVVGNESFEQVVDERTEIDIENAVNISEPHIKTSPSIKVRNVRIQTNTELNIPDQELNLSDITENQTSISKIRIKLQDDVLSHDESLLYEKNISKKTSRIDSYYMDSNSEECGNAINELEANELTDVPIIGSSELDDANMTKNTSIVASNRINARKYKNSINELSDVSIVASKKQNLEHIIKETSILESTNLNYNAGQSENTINEHEDNKSTDVSINGSSQLNVEKMTKKTSKVENPKDYYNAEEYGNTINELEENVSKDLLIVGTSEHNIEYVQHAHSNDPRRESKKRKRPSKITLEKNLDTQKLKRRSSNNNNKSNDTSAKEKCKPKTMDLELDHKKHDANKNNSEKEETKHEELHTSDLIINTGKEDAETSVTCGICKWAGSKVEWLDHIFKEHQYLAWNHHELPLDFDDQNKVLEHLKNLLRELKILECNKCGVKRKYAKGFLTHIHTCKGYQRDDSVAEASFQDNEDNENSTQNTDVPQDINHDNFTLNNNTQQEVNVDNNPGIICGACQWEGNRESWFQHLHEQHNYIAWKRNDTPLDSDNEIQMLEHLKILLQELKILECNKCGVKRKYAKAFWTHVNNCKGDQRSDSVAETSFQENEFNGNSTLNNEMNKEINNVNSTLNNDVKVEINVDAELSVICGVCQWEGNGESWHQHLCDVHNYIAWKNNETPLDENDEDMIINHLKQILQKELKLVCKNCGLERKYAKSFWNHWRNCKYLVNTNSDVSQCMQAESSVNEIENNDEIAVKRRRTCSSNDDDNVSLKKLKENEKTVQCGRCNEVVDGSQWKVHLIQHNYVAWIKGDQPIDEDSKSAVKAQLLRSLANDKVLTCKHCKSSLTSVFSFQYHITRCEEKVQNNEQPKKRYVRKSEVVLPTSQVPTTDPVKCAVCSKEMPKNKWQIHLEKKHYNLAWFEGGVPFDIMDHNLCHLILNELVKKQGKLVCVRCGLTRISGAGFYTHVITCGKSLEEIDAMKEECALCGRKFLPVALSAHMLTHRNIVEVPEKDDPPELPNKGGRRKAAVAAKANIEKITTELVKGANVCPCGHIAETAEELSHHKCSVSANQSVDGSDQERAWTSESDESESEVNEQLSDDSSAQLSSDEEQVDCEKTGKQYDDGSRSFTRFDRAPYRVGADDAIIASQQYKKYVTDFCESHLTSTELLFPSLKCNEFVPTLQLELDQYMPPLTRSCKYYKQLSKDDRKFRWKSFDLFESVNDKLAGQIFFVGGPVTGVSFVPPKDRMSCQSAQHYIAVTCQRDVELRGMHSAQLYEHSDLIQIWSFGNFESKENATFVLGIAHDNGTVWSIDWCPSGGWEEMEPECKSERLKRLGLMAAACSNGTVYVYAVCHPQQLPKIDLPIYKTKPVMELKLSSDGYARQTYQATAVHWSVEKGHKLISVGYANGTVALYDITTQSPLLRVVQDGTVIVNPYFDNALADSCVLKLLIYPQKTPTEDVCIGAWSTKSGELSVRTASGTAPVHHQRFLVGGAQFAPYWPDLHLQGAEISDGGLEVNWLPTYTPMYRRVCGEPPFAMCLHSRRLALASQGGQIILVRNVVPGSDVTKKNLLRTFEMVPIVKGAKAISGKESQAKSYEEATKNYGLLSSCERRPRENLRPEDYPLCGLTAITFSPCRCHLNRLVFAGVAGLVHAIRL